MLLAPTVVIISCNPAGSSQATDSIDNAVVLVDGVSNMVQVSWLTLIQLYPGSLGNLVM